jgi:hypothetical protein
MPNRSGVIMMMGETVLGYRNDIDPTKQEQECSFAQEILVNPASASPVKTFLLFHATAAHMRDLKFSHRRG